MQNINIARVTVFVLKPKWKTDNKLNSGLKIASVCIEQQLLERFEGNLLHNKLGGIHHHTGSYVTATM